MSRVDGQVTISLDWSENHSENVNNELNNQRSNCWLAMCPGVSRWWWAPESQDPSDPEAEGDMRGYIFISCVDRKKKGKHTTAFLNTLTHKVLEGKKLDWSALKAVILDTDGCAGQYKCGRVFGCYRAFAKLRKVTLIAFQNVATHGKSWSDGLGGATKMSFRQEEVKPSGIKFEPLNSTAQCTFAKAATALYNARHTISKKVAGWRCRGPRISPWECIDYADSIINDSPNFKCPCQLSPKCARLVRPPAHALGEVWRHLLLYVCARRPHVLAQYALRLRPVH